MKTTKLLADGGKKITNKNRSFFSDFIYLGKNDSTDNYEEVGREVWKHFIKEEGVVLDFELQPKYILQEGFVKDGKKIQAITYKADFKVMYANGLEEVIDVKGKLTESFKIKRKMLLYKYRDIDFKCLQEKGRSPNKYWVQIL